MSFVALENLPNSIFQSVFPRVFIARSFYIPSKITQPSSNRKWTKVPGTFNLPVQNIVMCFVQEPKDERTLTLDAAGFTNNGMDVSWQRFDFNPPIITSFIRLEAVSVYESGCTSGYGYRFIRPIGFAARNRNFM